MSQDGPCGGVHAAAIDSPKLLAGEWIVADNRAGAGIDELVAAVDLEDGWCGIAFLEIAIVRAVVDVAIFFPDSFARFLIKGDDELHVVTVEVHDQEILPEDRRRAGPA